MTHVLLALLVAAAQQNQAVGKKAHASSEEAGKGNLAAKAVDGDPETRWCAAAGTLPQSLSVDLGKPRNLKSLRIRWESEGGSYAHVVEVSPDGRTWTKVVEATTNGLSEHNVDAPGTKHLRITCTKTHGGWASIAELEAYDGPLPPLISRPEDLLKGVKAPPGFEVTLFGAPPDVNYPVCIAAAPGGEVFIGVDENGSLGKEPQYGKVLRCRDTDGDGRADEIKVFAKMRHPRGLVWDRDTLWVLHPPFLTRYRDADGDGVADEEKVLIKGISPEELVAKRGGDHTTNAIRMGIDGWIYIAVGDFGYRTAVDASGKATQLLGGGIARVRPDGTELEVYARGLRNICDVAIDPFLNLFTRDNTNDGGGWDIRVSHVPPTAQMGYPSLFKNFPDEIFPPLMVDGGGSGTGALYVDEPAFPEPYRKALLTADWGRNRVFFHPLEPKGASFAVKQQDFLTIERPTGLDSDGRGNLYVASWRGGQFAYKGPNVGYVVRLRPKQPGSGEGAVLRLAAQREALRVNKAPDPTAGPLESRVAALWTLKQLGRNDDVLKLVDVPDLREHALRALADRRSDGVPLAPFLSGLTDPNPRVRAAAAVALPRLPVTKVSGSFVSGPLVKATGDADPVVAHLAVHALVELQAAKACLEALDVPGARRALRSMHTAEAVDGLIAALDAGKGPREEILALLVRLYFKEGEWPVGEWWGTRPDTSGPYYRRAKWAETPKIEARLKKEEGPLLTQLLVKHKVVKASDVGAAPEVDVKKVLAEQAKRAKDGVGGMSFEAASAAILKETGDAKQGQQLFLRQGCVSCHTVTPDEPPRGPMLKDIAKRYSKPELLASILKPSAVIAQGFGSVIFGLTNGDRVVGFVTSEGAEDLTLRTASGEEMTLVKSRIEARRDADLSMMPDGLVAGLSPKEVAALLAYLETLK